MKKHYKWNVKKFIINMLALLGAIVMIWAILSYIEIVIKNVGPNPDYLPFNLFTLLVERLG